MGRPQRFDTWHQTIAGLLWIYAETYVVIVRLSDGKSGSFTWEQLGFAQEKAHG